MEIKKEEFGTLETGEKISKYKLITPKIQVNVLDYGGIITEIYAPDKEGKKENVVLGFDNLANYEQKSPYFGAIIGRNAGRIEGAEFKLNGQAYNLTANDGENNLHSGPHGLDKRVWEVTEIESGIELEYCSPHLEGGFPGTIDFTVRYLLEGNKLIIEYEGQADRETIINLTNHSYFNLSGGFKRDILEHKLKIKAEQFLCLDQNSIPTGEIRRVNGTPFDFRNFKSVGQEIDSDYRQLEFTDGYDHPLILEEAEENIALKDEKSGRILKISTDQAVVVFYSGNKLGTEGKLNVGRESKPRLGLCLETQDYPNAVNEPNFPTKVYNQDKKYKAKTEYEFAVNKK
ncbi:aldose epimerase family protein [Halanaerobacter jeridensis]|uniref:Aldose 1-epimerase n=1 Tax=Halanaerobacter jeridensis TaxID=706427 RepID=A0A938XU78_9FIRM|nr:aldose epimerase family protein [Halanaerobacter jeridensis]MBM7555662.1 aldose 1-epimerase [Halanaerobacter jeridensis]